MHTTRHLTLLIADLIPPPGFALPVAMPALDELLARCLTKSTAGCTLEDTLLAEFATDGFAPIAALTHLADYPGPAVAETTWIRADPVHFAVSRDNMQLFDSHVVKPTADEMLAIAETINSHFVEDGLVVHFADAARGYIEINANDIPVATPIWAMSDASVFDNLPRITTKTRTNWRARTNEIQMLLHDHPVNQAREAAGAVPINGLWLWGGGSLKDFDGGCEYDHVVARLALARGLAAVCGCPQTTLPTSMNEWLANPAANAKNTLVVLHTATREIRSQAREAWPIELASIDRDWITPAVAALDQGTLTSLTLVIPNETKTLTLTAKANGLIGRIKRLVSTKKSIRDFV